MLEYWLLRSHGSWDLRFVRPNNFILRKPYTIPNTMGVLSQAPKRNLPADNSGQDSRGENGVSITGA